MKAQERESVQAAHSPHTLPQNWVGVRQDNAKMWQQGLVEVCEHNSHSEWTFFHWSIIDTQYFIGFKYNTVTQ